MADLICLDEDTLAALADGALPDDDRCAVEVHMDRCDRCAALAAEFARGLVADTTGDGPARPWPAIGAVAGRYRIEGWLASGGMGQLYVARDPRLDRRVALKLVHGDRPGAAGELLVEAQAMARLSHPNVVAVHDVGAAGEETFIAMELVVGESLDAWQRTGARTWQRTLEAYLQAARGLGAAHAAGSVHGDFKPANALVRSDGRVQVTDFGLARAGLATPDDALPSGAEDLLRTTTWRGLAGTPAYMAPEQLRSEAATAASDQFSFCVALWEALHGERPFAGDDLASLAASVGSGRLRAPPAGSRVPRRVRRVVERGLEVAPAARHPSVDALVYALERARSPVGRRIVAAGALAVAAVATAGVVLARGGGDGADPACATADSRARAIWNPAARARLRGAFLATQTIYGEAASRTVEQRFDRHARRTVEEIEATCRDRPDSPEEAALIAERRACLDDGLVALQALQARMLEGERAVLDAGVRAAFGLPDPALCADVRDRVGDARVPEEAAARVAALRTRQAIASARRATDGDAAALAELEQLAREAAATGYRPLEADVLGSLTTTRMSLEQWDRAAESAHASLQAAQAIGSGSMVARAAIYLAQIIGRDPKRGAEASRWADLAASAIESLAGERTAPELRAALAGARGDIAERTGQFETALQHYEERAAEEVRAHPGEVHHHVAATSHQAAVALERLGRHAEAAEAAGRAIAIYQQIYGPRHRALVQALTLLGTAQNEMGALDAAIATHRHAADVSAAVDGEDSVAIAGVYNNLALALEMKEELAEAAALLERAAAIYRKAGSRDRLGITMLNLSGLSSELGRHDVAVAQAREAIQLVEEVFGPDHSHLASALTVFGDALCDSGDCAAARAPYERSLAIRRKSLGARHPGLAFSLVGLARVDTSAGAHRKATQHLERALAVASPAERPRVAFSLAKAIRAGGDRARAASVARGAREGATDELRGVIDAWLAGLWNGRRARRP